MTMFDGRKVSTLAVLLLAYGGVQVSAFSTTTVIHQNSPVIRQNALGVVVDPKESGKESSTALFSEPSKKGGLETGLRSKLVSESIAPWRTLRLFAYGALGSGAFIGGLINISGAIAGSKSPDFNLNTEVGLFQVLLSCLEK
jgi:hypothetical protein